jgi:hypothetical protein
MLTTFISYRLRYIFWLDAIWFSVLLARWCKAKAKVAKNKKINCEFMKQ